MVEKITLNEGSSIASHVPPRHMDDFLAIALMMMKNPHAKVEFFPPQRVPPFYLEFKKICLIDIGQDYNPELKNYDHHQDISLPSSFVMILENEFGSANFESETIRFIDLMDRYGVKKASELTGVPLNPEEDRMRKEILLIDLAKHGVEVGRIVLETLKINGYSEWLRTFYQKLDDKKLLDEPREILKREEELFKERLSKAKILHKDNLKILISNQSLAPNHFRVFETGVDLIIERNIMKPEHTSIIKNTSSIKTGNIDLAKVFTVYPKIFLHQNGFIAVIDASIEEVSIEEILEIILEKKEA